MDVQLFQNCLPHKKRNVLYFKVHIVGT